MPSPRPRRGFTFDGARRRRCAAGPLAASTGFPPRRRQLACSSTSVAAEPARHHVRPRSRPRASTCTWPTRSWRSTLAGGPRRPPTRRSRLWRRVSRASRWPSPCRDARVALVESVGRKCAFLAARGRRSSGSRTWRSSTRGREAWPDGLGAHDLVAARAAGAAAGARRVRGAAARRRAASLVAWKGRREPAEEADGAAAAAALGMSAPERDRRRAVPGRPRSTPLPQLEGEPDAGRYPRRPGMARKRPIRASS